ncbi:MAG: hypothetical protein GY832_16730 [Chloroflexi bacterium]|nr:hypothetical protein [Chloroflexota bacterium]
MKTQGLWLTLAIALTMLILPVEAISPSASIQSVTTATFGNVMFIENVGQFPSGVRFYAYGSEPVLWLHDDGLWLEWTEAASDGIDENIKAVDQGGIYAPYDALPNVASAQMPAFEQETSHIFKVRFVGANPAAQPEPFGRLDTRIHAYPSTDPASWHTDIPAWRGVRYPNLYPGVDLEIVGTDGRLTWQLVCKADCQSAQQNVSLHVEGADAVQVTDNELHIATNAGEFTLLKPTFEPTTLAPHPTPPRAFLDNPGGLIAGTFLGGNSYDDIMALAVGADGTIYVAGNTQSTDGEFTDPFFVAAFDPDLRTRQFITFIGGERDYDSLNNLALDAAGNIYVVGTTHSRQFPVTAGAFDTLLNDGRAENCPVGWGHLPCPDAFAAKLNAAGQLVYATYVGGAQMMIPGLGNRGGDDYGIDIAADNQGNMYVAGNTDSDDFPTTAGAFDRTFSYMDIGLNPDVFVVKIWPGGTGSADLRYATYVGSGFVNSVRGMTVDANGVVYATGSVAGEGGFVIEPKIDFPRTTNAYPLTSQCLVHQCSDVFFFKLDPTGNGSADLLYGTLFGGTGYESYERDRGDDVTLGSDGTVYLIGTTETSDFPTTSGAFLETPFRGFDKAAFIARMNPAGNGAADLLYATYLGGASETSGEAIAVDDNGEIYVTGETSAYNFPFTPGALDSTLDGPRDAFVTHLTPQGQGSDDLIYSTYLGGISSDTGYGLCVGSSGGIYVGGSTSSSDFPIPPDAYDPTLSVDRDGFLVELLTQNTSISGQVTDSNGEALSGIAVSTGSTYSTTTDANGSYTLSDLSPGTYTVTLGGGYFWTPEQRIVTAPPDATGQDFGGYNLEKSVVASSSNGSLSLGSRLTYTVRLVFPDAASCSFYDAVPTYTTYVTGTLDAPPGVVYDSSGDAITGSLAFTPTIPFSITFAVRSNIAGTVGFAPLITNRACAYSTGNTLAECAWSNTVQSYSHVLQIYLPLVLRSAR